MSHSEFHSGFISIIGRPNVGKSTLLNQILQEKVAIISDKPQTTRNRILGVKHLPDSQLIFLDTPGIHKPQSKLNQRMVRVARDTLEEVDLIFFMIEATEANRIARYKPLKSGGDRFILDWIHELKTPVFLIINKMDLIKKERIIPLLQDCSAEFSFAEIVPVSARTGYNIDRLLKVAGGYIPEGAPIFPEDVVTDQPVRFIAGELIREKILHHTRQEIPYSVAVIIEEFKEEKDKPTRILATIFVERDSHKGILIGKRGDMLKKVGTEARKEMEALFGNKVYLELWVKVQKDWRQNEPLLTELGY